MGSKVNDPALGCGALLLLRTDDDKRLEKGPPFIIPSIAAKEGPDTHKEATSLAWPCEHDDTTTRRHDEHDEPYTSYSTTLLPSLSSPPITPHPILTQASPTIIPPTLSTLSTLPTHPNKTLLNSNPRRDMNVL
ncbi:hypothetical protein IAQ61_011685 [Plenodomus lingam]|uniref:uncharacterized protein n=1 Tax=Leptosphaeria maculans TaxID=5022 RepID=UPI00331E9900|nr:hypothetical protein IAQ61_011685 [Plenodomus lingam]